MVILSNPSSVQIEDPPVLPTSTPDMKDAIKKFEDKQKALVRSLKKYGNYDEDEAQEPEDRNTL